ASVMIVTVGRLRSGKTSIGRPWSAQTPRRRKITVPARTRSRFLSENAMMRSSMAFLPHREEGAADLLGSRRDDPIAREEADRDLDALVVSTVSGTDGDAPVSPVLRHDHDGLTAFREHRGERRRDDLLRPSDLDVDGRLETDAESPVGV